jgi:hypothetical protein
MFFNLECFFAGMHREKFSIWVVLMRFGVRFSGGCTIRESVDDKHVLENPFSLLGTGFGGFNQ